MMNGTCSLENDDKELQISMSYKWYSGPYWVDYPDPCQCKLDHFISFSVGSLAQFVYMWFHQPRAWLDGARVHQCREIS